MDPIHQHRVVPNRIRIRRIGRSTNIHQKFNTQRSRPWRVLKAEVDIPKLRDQTSVFKLVEGIKGVFIVRDGVPSRLGHLGIKADSYDPRLGLAILTKLTARVTATGLGHDVVVLLGIVLPEQKASIPRVNDHL